MVRATSRDGFTLLEMLLVMALITLLLAMVLPAVETIYLGTKLQGAADHLRARIAECRARAIEEGRSYQLAIAVDTPGYRLAPDTATHWDGGTPDAQEDNAVPPLVIEDQLPNGIVFRAGGPGQRVTQGNWTRLLTFLPDGTCEEDCSIRLELDGAEPLEVNVRGLSGAVTVGKPRE